MLLRHCNTAFMKHVFPWLRRPETPGTARSAAQLEPDLEPEAGAGDAERARAEPEADRRLVLSVLSAFPSRKDANPPSSSDSAPTLQLSEQSVGPGIRVFVVVVVVEVVEVVVVVEVVMVVSTALTAAPSVTFVPW